MKAVGSNKIEELRNAKNELERLGAFFSLPVSEPLDFIETLLPMANKYSSFQEKADAYHLLRHGQIIGFPEDMDSSKLPKANLPKLGGSDSGG